MRILKRLAVGLLVLFGAVQLVPYGHRHDNPPVAGEPAWPDPKVRALAQRACFDCHSNQTHWPFYAHVAPVSWLVQYDVEQGRQALNFSEWTSSALHAEEPSEPLLEGEMPPRIYTLLHRDAVLTATERATLARGLDQLAPQGGDGEREGHERPGHEGAELDVD